MDCIIHIGANKAGSTSLQRAFSLHADALKRHGLYYINTGRAFRGDRIDRHIGFRFAMTPANMEVLGILPQHGLNSARDRLNFNIEFARSFEQEISSLPPDGTVVISDEDLFNFSSEALAEKSRNFLASHFSRISIVFYVRRPDKYVASFYSQHVKMGGAMTLVEVVDDYLGYRRYHEVLEDWIKAFGIQNIKLGVCEKDFLHEGNIVSDFCQILGISPDFDTDIALNTSLSALGCDALRIINESFGYGYDRVPRLFRQALERQFSGHDHHLTPEMLEKIYLANVEDHKKLVSAFGLKEGVDIYALRDLVSGRSAPGPRPDGVSAAQIANLMLDMYHHPDFPK